MAVVSSMAWLTPGVPGDVAASGDLAGFRAGWYGCLGPWAGCALRGSTDAVLCAGGPVTSLPRLSLEPVLRRGRGSEARRWRAARSARGGFPDLLATRRPAGWPLDIRGGWHSLAAVCGGHLPGPGLVLSPVPAGRGQAGGPGWCYQKVSQLNFARDSWTWPVDARRIGPREDVAAATVAQVRGVLARLGAGDDVPLFVSRRSLSESLCGGW